MYVCMHVCMYYVCMYVLRIYVCIMFVTEIMCQYIFILFTNISSCKSASVLCKHQLCCITFFSHVRKYIMIRVVKCKRPHCENSQLTLTVYFKYAQSQNVCYEDV